jgi:hypothetical protein
MKVNGKGISVMVSLNNVTSVEITREIWFSKIL